ncbi:hypothetical protein M440DRAFT_1401924 [Trichoderma longibrachiatum ATCC 18648]|uniref:Uncharacterized protein n=1 Tax=Trichoderma longibrachiatum ATCC 18648 TaxID=983965 RepID=A0A2T4C4H8_TRILO|nr:hypothetical protein M440DRAFT_1401924 [Trichoderma longibrachiatum ATCC 18648]
MDRRLRWRVCHFFWIFSFGSFLLALRWRLGSFLPPLCTASLSFVSSTKSRRREPKLGLALPPQRLIVFTGHSLFPLLNELGNKKDYTCMMDVKKTNKDTIFGRTDGMR